MTPQTVEEAIHNLRVALRIEQSQAIVKHLEAVLGSKPATNGHAKRPYRRSPAGRARQIAAMKAYWAKRRKAKSRG